MVGGPVVRNEVTAPAVGVLAQVGVVHGGLHVHPPAAVVVPRQLPASPRSFAGRAGPLAELDRACAAEGAAVAVSAIGGAGGIGKTWLVLHWAHHNAHRFPDGQLFVNLHGFSPAEDPVTPDAALFGFLTALGVAPRGIPTDLASKSALYRSLVADRRVLVVLDNAATGEQVAPLLPGGASCTVLVTGRTRLASLVDRHGAHHLRLDVLTREEARDLLVRRLGPARPAAEPDAADELIALCGRYPLALSIMARHARAHPSVPLAELAAELRELGLELLDHDTDPAAGLPGVLSWSLRGLTAEQREVFALLGTAPGPDIGLPAATSLTGSSARRTREVLRVLEDASLIERHPRGRYAMHDLIRDCAAASARALAEPARRAALDRVVDFYLHTAHTADRVLSPHRRPIRLDPPTPGTHPHPLPDHPTALAWLDAEHLHVLAAQRTAAAHHRHRTAWRLAWTQQSFHERRGHHHDDLAVWRVAAAAADHLDPGSRALAHRRLGVAHAHLGQHEEAIEHLGRALTLAADDPGEQAHTHNNLARAWALRHDHPRALEHARHAVDLYRALGHPVWEADALNAAGWYAAHLGDHDTAREHCLAALDLNRRHHEPAGEAETLDSLGWIAHQTGRHHEAVDHYRRALTLLRDLGATQTAAETLDHLGQAHTALGRHHRARTAWREALRLYRHQGRDADAERVARYLDTRVPGARRTP
ncbi:ATP-binding protein [Saccharothrix lopnurensis]|uniref:ATP-binding protein n=1 Tax=Saccharothrix lopnurensis TaxID=1670621 RepID=A0ABW1NYW3_9PSEU